MEPSEEIRRIVERWTRAHIEGDHESALERLSELPDTLIIGNDPNEWWHGGEARAIWARQLEEPGSFPLTQDTFYGTTVNYAARVANQALGGEVLVSSVVRELLSGSEIPWIESREVELKGLDGQHRLSAVDHSGEPE